MAKLTASWLLITSQKPSDATKINRKLISERSTRTTSGVAVSTHKRFSSVSPKALQYRIPTFHWYSWVYQHAKKKKFTRAQWNMDKRSQKTVKQIVHRFSKTTLSKKTQNCPKVLNFEKISRNPKTLQEEAMQEAFSATNSSLTYSSVIAGILWDFMGWGFWNLIGSKTSNQI